MRKVKKSVDRVIELITCTLFMFMVAVASWQVLSRFILKSPSTVTEELLRYSLIWLAMLSAAYVVGKNQHIAITMLRDRINNHSKITLDIVIQSIFLLFSAIIMVYGGGRAVSLTITQISPALHLSMGFVYLALPLSGVIILFYGAVNLVELIKKKNEMTFVNEEKKAS